MADNVVPLRPPAPANEDARELCLTTPCVCLACRHRWQVVAPVGTNGFRCPSCDTMRGVSTAHVLPDDGVVWTCGCGSFAFCCSSQFKAWLCLSCGEVARF